MEKNGRIRIEPLTTEEELQMEICRRSLRSLSRTELLAFADQLIWGHWHQERVLKALSHHVIELEMELNSDNQGRGDISEEHLQWARDLWS